MRTIKLSLVLFFMFIFLYKIESPEVLKKEDRQLKIEIETLAAQNVELVKSIEELYETEYKKTLQSTDKNIECDEIEILAKLLYCEAGSMSWDAQVYTCSAILNMSEYYEESINSLAHKPNVYSVAPYVDGAQPKEMQYEVIDYVLNGGRIPEICYFRTDYYHSFGTPVCEVGGHYFSKP